MRNTWGCKHHSREPAAAQPNSAHQPESPRHESSISRARSRGTALGHQKQTHHEEKHMGMQAPFTGTDNSPAQISASGCRSVRPAERPPQESSNSRARPRCITQSHHKQTHHEGKHIGYERHSREPATAQPRPVHSAETHHAHHEIPEPAPEAPPKIITSSHTMRTNTWGCKHHSRQPTTAQPRTIHPAENPSHKSSNSRARPRCTAQDHRNQIHHEEKHMGMEMRTDSSPAQISPSG